MTSILISCLIALLAVAFAAAGWAARGWREAARDRDRTLQTLETERRIADATRDPLPAGDARDRLREFGTSRPAARR